MWYDAEPSVIALANPGAGNDAVLPVPGSERQVLVSVAFVLTASGVAGTRTPILKVADGSGVVICAAVAGFSTGAGTTVQYTYANGLTEWDANTATFASGPCPELPLGLGNTITVHVDGGDVGDTLTAIRFGVVQMPVRDADSG